MEEISFNNLPKAIHDIRVKIDNLSKQLEEIKKQHQSVKQEKDLLTVNEAAKLLDLSPYTIYSKKCREGMPYIKRNKRLYFSKKELLQYLNGEKIHEEIEDSYPTDILMPKRKQNSNRKI